MITRTSKVSLLQGFAVNLIAEFTNVTMAENAAEKGGAIHGEGRLMELQLNGASNITRNSASREGGGAISLVRVRKVNLSESRFEKNSASSSHGGAVFYEVRVGSFLKYASYVSWVSANSVCHIRYRLSCYWSARAVCCSE